MMRQNNMRNQKKEGPKEEYAIILDIFKPSQFKDETVIQAIGETLFTLLELAPKPGVELRIGDRVYIGDGKRDDIQFIKRAIWPDKLTIDSKDELEYVLIDLVNQRESEFINFFNNAGGITIRRHALELIPGIGKKHLKDLIDERDNKFFESFKELSERCTFLSNPQKAIADRIIAEMNDQADFKLFVRK